GPDSTSTAPIPARRIKSRALLSRPTRSAAAIGGGIGMDGRSVAPWIAAQAGEPRLNIAPVAEAMIPPSSARRLVLPRFIVTPVNLKGRTVARPSPMGQQRRPMFDAAFQDSKRRH